MHEITKNAARVQIGCRYKPTPLLKDADFVHLLERNGK
jgi:hypothetical protein